MHNICMDSITVTCLFFPYPSLSAPLLLTESFMSFIANIRHIFYSPASPRC